jgi:hypothetical protein
MAPGAAGAASPGQWHSGFGHPPAQWCTRRPGGARPLPSGTRWGSEHQRSAGWSHSQVTACTEDGPRYHAIAAGPGDPATAVMAGETAHAPALAGDRLPTAKGSLTPALHWATCSYSDFVRPATLMRYPTRLNPCPARRRRRQGRLVPSTLVWRRRLFPPFVGAALFD